MNATEVESACAITENTIALHIAARYGRDIAIRNGIGRLGGVCDTEGRWFIRLKKIIKAARAAFREDKS
jgi:hypothetical protein